MARFKQVTEAFISRKLVEFWGNMVKNYTGDVSDCDFFEILCDHYEHDKAVELIEKAYSAKQLKEMMGGMGINSIEALRGNRLMLRGIGLSETELRILGIKHAGE